MAPGPSTRHHPSAPASPARRVSGPLSVPTLPDRWATKSPKVSSHAGFVSVIGAAHLGPTNFQRDVNARRPHDGCGQWSALSTIENSSWLGYKYNIRSTERIEICGHSDNSTAILSISQEIAPYPQI